MRSQAANRKSETWQVALALLLLCCGRSSHGSSRCLLLQVLLKQNLLLLRLRLLLNQCCLLLLLLLLLLLFVLEDGLRVRVAWPRLSAKCCTPQMLPNAMVTGWGASCSTLWS